MDPQVITGHLIATLDKRATLDLLRKWRRNSKTALEANAFRDVMQQIESGELDG